MKRHARKAFNALKKLNAPVHEDMSHKHFTIGAERRTDDDKLFADYYQEEVREHLSNGKIVNAFGIRQDVIDILEENGLYGEWNNPGQLGVYDAY